MEIARALMERKDKIQEELNAQFSVLKSESCTMNTPLARVHIIKLRNDLEDVTDKIKLALEVLHNEPREVEHAPPPILMQTQGNLNEATEQDVEQLKPFARVDGIMPRSPAADAGLRREDLLLLFGHLNASSFTGASLQPIAELVSRHENRPLEVKVRRGTENITISFTPRNGWGGRGMLGCHIVPYTS